MTSKKQVIWMFLSSLISLYSAINILHFQSVFSPAQMIVPTGCQGILLDFSWSEGVHYLAFEVDGYLSFDQSLSNCLYWSQSSGFVLSYEVELVTGDSQFQPTAALLWITQINKTTSKKKTSWMNRQNPLEKGWPRKRKECGVSQKDEVRRWCMAQQVTVAGFQAR